MRRLLVAIVAALALAGPVAGRAAWPERPITMIVPFPAGGPTDVIARTVAAHMGHTLGQPIVVENVAGGGGTTGSLRAARAAPDGYTVEMGHMGTHGAAPAAHPDLAYDPARDFEPIGLVAGTAIVVVGRKDLPPNDLKELVAYLRKQGRKVREAHAGAGSVSFTTCTLLERLAGATPTRVAYHGTGPALTDLVAGRVDFMCDQIVNLVPPLQAGTLKAYAVAVHARSHALPGIPTTDEAGLPAFKVTAWNALFAPRGTPREIVQRLNAALLAALDDPATRRRLLELGADLSNRSAMSPEGLRQLVASEVRRWRKVLSSAGPARDGR
jgi:tripartite-type tricarboxylate transporter receptor subunit TctC